MPSSSRLRAVLLTALAVLTTLLVTGAPTSASATPSPDADISFSDSVLGPGEELTVTFETVGLTTYARANLGRVSAMGERAASFAATAALPLGSPSSVTLTDTAPTTPGTYYYNAFIHVTDGDYDLVESWASITVLSDEPDYPSRWPDVTATWPSPTAGIGSSAVVAVAGTDLDGPVTVTVRVAPSAWNAPAGPVVGSTVIMPARPTATVALPTSKVGTVRYAVSAESARSAYGIDNRTGQLTVVGYATRASVVVPSLTVRAGARKTVTGSVSQDVGAPAGRTVQLQAQGRNGTWVPLAETTVAADGRFTVALPTWWATTMQVRAFVVGDDTHEPVAAGSGRLKVRRSYKPAAGSAYRLLWDQGRWDPCQVITYRVNTARMPAGALADLRYTFGEISAATGLRFRYAGKSSYVPMASRGRTDDQPATDDMFIAWAPPSMVRGLAGWTIGLGGSSVSGGELFAGHAVLDSTWRPRGNAPQRRRQWIGLYLHEIGHAIGLTHVNDRRQVMVSGLPPSGFLHYGSGDLRGLAKVGATGGCNDQGNR